MSDFFVDEDEKAITNPFPEPEVDESICRVSFVTTGRLSAPETLHFYDYNMAAAQYLAELGKNDDHMETIIKVLNSMVVEDFDCGLLHIEEIKEVLMNIHAKWWGPNLEGFKYLLNPDAPEEERFEKENISSAIIPIANIVVKPLAEGIIEPINVPVRNYEVSFLFPRAQNSVIARKHVEKLFNFERQKYHELSKTLASNARLPKEDQKPIDPAEAEAYQQMLVNMANERLLATRAQMLYSVNGKVLESFEERLEAVKNDKRISVVHWKKFNDFLDSKGEFGVQKEVEFYSDILDQKVKRPFQFRTVDFIPSVDSIRDESGEISFG